MAPSTRELVDLLRHVLMKRDVLTGAQFEELRLRPARDTSHFYPRAAEALVAADLAYTAALEEYTAALQRLIEP